MFKKESRKALLNPSSGKICIIVKWSSSLKNFFLSKFKFKVFEKPSFPSNNNSPPSLNICSGKTSLFVTKTGNN